MLTFLAENWGTIVLGIALLAVVILIVVKLVRDRRKGKSSCGCGCDNCPSSCMCHKK